MFLAVNTAAVKARGGQSDVKGVCRQALQAAVKMSRVRIQTSGMLCLLTCLNNRHHMSNYLELHKKMEEREGEERACEECNKKVSSIEEQAIFEAAPAPNL